MPTKKSASRPTDDLRPEYDFAALGRGVRGKYFERASSGTNIVRLDPDLAPAFPTSESVNTALRMLVDIAEATSQQKKSSVARKR
ncbi:MAG TPA: hypothetical protein VGS57_08195 [Thermoanaerobaculia bacterium]|jgi:hypothetical protein|nr:hypothetical protein [Thermoanaerobaculia bacterium]